MIVAVTPNPSFDHTYQVERLERGAVTRASGVSVEAAGKGVNLARNSAANGTSAVAVIPASALDAAAFRAELEPVGVSVRTAERAEATRRNITVLDADGVTTKVNEGGAALDETCIEALFAGVAAAGDDIVAGCGSLAPGTDPRFYARLADSLPDSARQLALDSSGIPLRECLDVPCLVVKPNRAELEELLDVRLDTYGDLVDASRSLVGRGWVNVLVSLGPAGAVLVNNDGVWAGDAPTDFVANTVGTGDALLGGFLVDRTSPEAALTSALAFARATVRSPLTAGAIVSEDDRRAVRLRPVVATDSLGEETG